MIHAKAIIFDYDGVLADSYQFHLKAVVKAVAMLGYKFDPLLYDDFFPSGISLKEGAIKFFQSLGRIDLVDEFIINKKSFDVSYKQEIQAISGSIEFVKKASSRYRLAIVSGTRRVLLDYFLNKYDLNKYFKTLIFYEDVTKSKPDPEGYLLALSRLHICPNEALVIEDGQNGIDAANLAKIPVIGFVKDKAVLHHTVCNFSSFFEIAKVLSC